MIDAGPLTQEDADEYRIEVDNLVENTSALYGTLDDGTVVRLQSVEMHMTNGDAQELAAQLLIGSVYGASDSDWRDHFWTRLLKQRIRSARKVA